MNKQSKQKDSEVVILEGALNAVRSATAPPAGSERKAEERELEILFFGLVCFDPLPDRPGFRVLFPNGLDLTELTDIPVHSAGLWIRGRDERVTARWSGLAYRNDFFVSGKQQLTITGLAKTPLDASELKGRLTNLQECDPEFRISDDPDAVIDMIVDRGTLSAHVGNDAGMIVVKWTVQVEDGAPVRFSFGTDFVEISPTTKQVVLANVSPNPDQENIRDFQLFRKLALYPDRPLQYRLPQNRPTDVLQVNEPTFGFPPAAPGSRPAATAPPPRNPLPIVGVVPQAVQNAIAQTPNVVCSAVVSRG